MCDKYGNLDKAGAEKLDKAFNEQYDANEPFRTFIKRVKDAMETVEAVHCPCEPSQIVNKSFNTINRANTHPEWCREWKHKSSTDKT